MLIDCISALFSRRLWEFNKRMYARRVLHGVPEPKWTAAQEEGIFALFSWAFNDDRPCKYARSRGE